MAYNFLELVNQVNRRFNEVELTSATFANAKGFYSSAKDSVNTALRDINQSFLEWPFNHVEQEETMSTGVSRYTYPTDSSTVDFDSFRIKEDSVLGNQTVTLRSITYEDYLRKYVGQEYSTDTSKLGIPQYVVQTPSQEFILVPAPDQDYELVYEYYRVPVDLQNSTDVPFIPERFRHVIIDGAMYHAYMFRGNEQSASMIKAKFDEEVKSMRIILINKYNYVTSTYIQQAGSNIAGARIK